MILLHDFVWALPFLLYAETHYRFPYFFSLLKKAEPELLADVPHRIEPGHALPVLVLAKDAHQYPSRLRSVRVIIRQHGQTIIEKEVLPVPVDLTTAFWWTVFPVPIEGVDGWIEVDVLMTCEAKGRVATYHADNYRTSSHKPFRIFIAKDPLPRLPGVFFGDPHTHSNYTNDQVEFGSPVGASIALAKAAGLSFYCVTDHSYDLDDSPDDYSVNDPSLPKWYSLQNEVRVENNRQEGFAVICGEEVTSRNANGKNVHFLLFGHDKFIPGSGDGAEQWLETKSEFSIGEILSNKTTDVPGYAAHPMEPVSILQRILLNRGPWALRDISDRRLTGIQFANGYQSKGFIRGYRAWIECLLKGQRLFCLAGNDAHGNFARFRQIGIPFFTIRENSKQLFGRMRTALFLRSRIDCSNVLQALCNGTSVITDGPIANILLSMATDTKTSIGETFVGERFEIKVIANSTSEFGPISEVHVYKGRIGAMSEDLLLKKASLSVFQIDERLTVTVEGHSYVRVEIFTAKGNFADGQPHFCMTNPVWFRPS